MDPATTRGTWRNNKGKPFTSDLSGQDFWTLIRAGYAPLDLVMGSCVYHVAHQRFGQVLGNMGRNVEIPQYTQALYDARELAMSRMQAEAEALHAEGIVGVQLRQHSHTWGGHTTEFFAVGTAVRPLRDGPRDRPAHDGAVPRQLRTWSPWVENSRRRAPTAWTWKCSRRRCARTRPTWTCTRKCCR